MMNSETPNPDWHIAIVMLCHNAPGYCFKALNSINALTPQPYSLIVVDNGSDLRTQRILKSAFDKKFIERLIFSRENLFFAAGNNLGVRSCPTRATHIVLLNSDIEIQADSWLKVLMDLHQPGITSFGAVNHGFPRADGYCLMIDRFLYERFWLDESKPWWWSVTKLQADVLGAGYPVRAVKQHERLLHHFGGKSGPIQRYLGANESGLSFDRQEAIRWFGGRCIQVIDEV